MAKKTKKKNDNILLRTLHGRILSSDFFINHWKSVLLALFMILIYINNRYQCATRMEHIRKLEQRLEIVETRTVGIHEPDTRIINAGISRANAPRTGNTGPAAIQNKKREQLTHHNHKQAQVKQPPQTSHFQPK